MKRFAKLFTQVIGPIVTTFAFACGGPLPEGGPRKCPLGEGGTIEYQYNEHEAGGSCQVLQSCNNGIQDPNESGVDTSSNATVGPCKLPAGAACTDSAQCLGPKLSAKDSSGRLYGAGFCVANLCSLTPPPVMSNNDKDGDGIIDGKDKCPDVAGPVINEGCPAQTNNDRDGDGIVNNSDSCPDVPGPATNLGCPEPICNTPGTSVDTGNTPRVACKPDCTDTDLVCTGNQVKRILPGASVCSCVNDVPTTCGGMTCGAGQVCSGNMCITAPVYGNCSGTSCPAGKYTAQGPTGTCGCFDYVDVKGLTGKNESGATGGAADGTADNFDNDGDCYCEQSPCVGSTATCTTMLGGDCDDRGSGNHPGAFDWTDQYDNACVGGSFK